MARSSYENNAMTTNPVGDGRELSQAYCEQVVRPVLNSRWPSLPHSAGRLGVGSDVLGFDTETSRDHDWGLRLSLLVEAPMIDQVHSFLDEALPDEFHGWPTRFAFTGRTHKVHHVEVDSVSGFATDRLGFDPRDGLNVVDWLSMTGQSVLEVTGGPVFVDMTGEISDVRSLLKWYPNDLWRYVIACAWLRVEEELPLMGRAGDRRDELGSRVIATRLVGVLIHLAFLIERQWAPYPKWRGTLLGQLRCAADNKPLLADALEASDWQTRQRALSEALDRMLEAQRAAGLPAPAPATVPFWDRPFRQPNELIAASLLETVADPAVRALPRGRGGAEQRSDNVAILVSPRSRRHLVSD